MNDAAGVGSLERFGDLKAEIENLVKRERASAKMVVEGAALKQFHGDEVSSVVLRDFVDGADVWVIERRGGARFAMEAVEHVGI